MYSLQICSLPQTMLKLSAEHVRIPGLAGSTNSTSQPMTLDPPATCKMLFNNNILYCKHWPVFPQFPIYASICSQP